MSTKIRAVIIDDEIRARNLLRQLILLHTEESVEVVGEASNVNEGIAIIQRVKPELVFLDIKMQGGTGFELLEQISEPKFEVIFITAYDQYAIQAIKFSAFGYLLKPIEIEELRNVIERLQNQRKLKKVSPDNRVKVLIENYGDEGKIRKLVITNMEGFLVLKLDQVIRLEGDRNYTNFILEGSKKETTSKSLGEYEEMLNDHGFFRIHQSTIINLTHVVSYEKGDGGKVTMIDGEKLQVSRHRKQQFLSRFF